MWGVPSADVSGRTAGRIVMCIVLAGGDENKQPRPAAGGGPHSGASRQQGGSIRKSR
ncbi:hypothetical protein GCM10010512_30970 [Streptomyces thermoviolaceus subsp. thermoviolaceus]|nr:hypothetical protein GCM10010512_30970 [Streptomyces thermoviolaceus subsp. thermoviolaceus]